MQLVYYTIAGILLYLLSDWILLRVEAWRGAAFEQRSLVFFAVILVLALTSFKAIELWLGS
jgi:hypothetical protein